MNNLYLIFPLVTATFGFFLGFYALYKNYKNRQNQLWFLTSFSISLWTLGLFGIFSSTNGDWALFFQKVLYLGTGLIPIFFFHYSLILTEQQNYFRKSLFVGYFLATFFSLLLLTNFLISGILPQNEMGYWPVSFTSLYFLFLIDFAFYITCSILVLTKGYKINKGEKKKQILFVSLAAIAGFIGGSTNFLLDFKIDIPLIYLTGNLLVIFYIVFITYGIIRHKLLDIRLVATEFFVSFLTIVTFLQIFQIFGGSIITRILTFFITLLIAFLLIRASLRELRRRDEMERLNTELESANAKLKELDKAKSDFIDMASHQLRTPLTAVRGWTSMLIQGDFGSLNEKQMNALNIVFMASDQQNNLVEDLLNAARIEAGRIEYNFEDVDLDQLADEVVKQLQPLAMSKKLPLSYIKPKKLLPIVKVDRVKIRQVVINLVENAVKYTSEGFVQASLEQADNKLRFCVTDTGMGISKKDFKNLFQKFGRGSNNQARAKGTGVGLYTAKIMLGAHPGGRIWAESEGEGKGSKFCFEISV